MILGQDSQSKTRAGLSDRPIYQVAIDPLSPKQSPIEERKYAASPEIINDPTQISV